MIGFELDLNINSSNNARSQRGIYNSIPPPEKYIKEKSGVADKIVDEIGEHMGEYMSGESMREESTPGRRVSAFAKVNEKAVTGEFVEGGIGKHSPMLSASKIWKEIATFDIGNTLYYKHYLDNISEPTFRDNRDTRDRESGEQGELDEQREIELAHELSHELPQYESPYEPPPTPGSLLNLKSSLTPKPQNIGDIFQEQAHNPWGNVDLGPGNLQRDKFMLTEPIITATTAANNIKNKKVSNNNKKSGKKGQGGKGIQGKKGYNINNNNINTNNMNTNIMNINTHTNNTQTHTNRKRKNSTHTTPKQRPIRNYSFDGLEALLKVVHTIESANPSPMPIYKGEVEGHPQSEPGFRGSIVANNIGTNMLPTITTDPPRSYNMQTRQIPMNYPSNITEFTLTPTEISPPVLPTENIYINKDEDQPISNTSSPKTLKNRRSSPSVAASGLHKPSSPHKTRKGNNNHNNNNNNHNTHNTNNTQQQKHKGNIKTCSNKFCGAPPKMVLNIVKCKIGGSKEWVCQVCHQAYLNNQFCDYCYQIYVDNAHWNAVVDGYPWIMCELCHKWVLNIYIYIYSGTLTL